MKHSNVLVLGMVSAAAVLSCGKKKSEVQDQVNTALDNALAIGYPDGLSIPTFPQTSNTLSSLADAGALGIETGDTKGQTLEQKRLDAKEILEGKPNDCFQNMRKRLRAPSEILETCYEFDQDMIFGHMGDAARTRGTKTGLSAKTDSKEACMVSFARDEMRQIEELIDQQLDRAQAMACIAKKNNKELPDQADESIDITTEMNAARPKDISNGPAFDSVVLKRLADKDSKAVYQTTVVSSFSDGKKEELTITHSPSTSDNSQYSGVISIKRSGELRDRQDGNEMNMLLSVQYARVEEEGQKKVRASVRRARKATSLATFDANGLVSFADVPDEASNTTLNAMALVEFDMNQSDSTGSLSYWRNPGGRLTEAARGFVFKVEADTSSTVKGCAISGAAFRDENNKTMDSGMSIRHALANNLEIKPNAWWHPQFHTEAESLPQGATAGQSEDFGDFNYKKALVTPQGSVVARWRATGTGDANAVDFVTKQFGNAVSRQCFKQNSDGVYVPDDSVHTGAVKYELIPIGSGNIIPPPRLGAVRPAPR